MADGKTAEQRHSSTGFPMKRMETFILRPDSA